MNSIDLITCVLSLKIAGIATLLVASTATPLAWLMARYKGSGRFFLEGLFLSPLLMPPTVTGFALLYVFGAQGPLGHLWIMVFGESLLFTEKAAVMAAAIVTFPLMYRTAVGAFAQVDPLCLDAARTFGANRWQVFRTIACSQAMPGLLSGMTLSFGRALGEFGATLIVAGNIEGRTQTIPLAMYTAIETGDTNRAAMWAAVLGVLAMGLTFGGQCLWQKRT